MTFSKKRTYLKDFLAKESSTEDFFSYSYFNLEDRKEVVAKAAQKSVSNAVLHELEEQNALVSKEVEASLAKLKAGNCAVAITGQQLGLFGGPLYTLYKILHTIKTAQVLEKESGIAVVPIFWLQAEDSDFEEIKTSFFPGLNNQISAVSLEIDEAALGDSVGPIKIDKAARIEIEAFLVELEDQELIDKEFFKVLLASYEEGTSLAENFAELIQALFSRFGLLVFNPMAKSIKHEFKDFIKQNFLESEAISNLLTKRSDYLESLAYDLQVKVQADSPLFFVACDGKRQRLKKLSDKEHNLWQGLNRTFTREELFDLLDKEPERFTTSALIRPLYQDLVFPTAAYIAGPSEFNYLVQIKDLYSHFNILQPLVIPRARFLLLDKKQTKLLEKYKLGLDDLTKEPKQILLQEYSGTELDSNALFSELDAEVLAKIDAKKEIFLNTDISLAPAIDKTKASILRNLEKLKSRFESALIKKDQALLNEFEQLSAMAYPKAEPQERVFCFSYFVLKYGVQVLDCVFDNIDVFGDDIKEKLIVLKG